MPYTIDGIGTGYCGKRNIHRHMSLCEFCGNYGQLTSYDTTIYAVFLHIPLIPLSKKRVLQECPSCRKHRIVKVKEWLDLKKSKIAEAVSKVSTDPHNRENIKNALGVFIGFEDRHSFDVAAAAVKQTHGGNPDLQLLLGEGYSFFNEPDLAEQSYRAALSQKDTPEIRRTLAIHLIKHGRSQQAESLLEHLKASADPEQMSPLLVLAQGYQTEGMHAEALQILNHCQTRSTVLAEDKAVTKLAELSKKNLTTGKKIKCVLFAQPDAAPEKSWSPTLAKWIGPAVALLVLGAYLSISHMQGKSQKVYLVNGLERSYKSRINGSTYSLPAKSFFEIHVPQGEVSVEILDESLGVPEQTCRVESSFWLRPFRKYTFVINPDQVAAVYWEQNYYTDREREVEVKPATYHVGELCYSFTGVDYHFEEFPGELRISQGSIAYRERIDLLTDLPPTYISMILARQNGQEAAQRYAERCISFNPGDEALLYQYASLARPEATIALMRNHLSKRPVLMDVHRIYQSLVEKEDPGHDLDKEYRGYLSQDPANGDLIYLLARVQPDEAKSRKLLEQSIEAGKPSAYGFYALSQERLAEANFQEAWDL